MSCRGCRGPLSQEYVGCPACGNRFHFGCSIPERVYKKMSVKKMAHWRCGYCHLNTPSDLSPMSLTSSTGGSSVGSSSPCGWGTPELGARGVLSRLEQRMESMAAAHEGLLREVTELRAANRLLAAELNALKLHCGLITQEAPTPAQTPVRVVVHPC